MKNSNILYTSPSWLPLATQLCHTLATVSSTAHDNNLLDQTSFSDLEKLTSAGERLEKFCTLFIQGNETDPRNIWHRLRNIITIIKGFSELITEQLTSAPNSPLTTQLQQVLELCKLLLAEENSSNSEPIIDEPVIATNTFGTILIVDDQQENREILRRSIQESHHHVFEAASGKQMFQLLANNMIDLIVLDMFMPEMNGEELLKQLKQDDTLRAIPIIVVSGNKDSTRVIRCIEAGAEDYLFKPVNPILLQARINAGVERKHWHDKEDLYRQELERNQSFIRKVFGRYLSDEIVSTLLENPDGLDLGGSQRKVTVMMADIRGFTSLAEQLPPQRVVRLLNNYLGIMSDIIMKYHGTVDEFIGDAILAIFGAPVSRENDSERAVTCALEMQAAMKTVNQRNKLEHLPEISIGISINTGLVVAGNIGSEKRAKYGVVGHTVNQTARIEEYCEEGKILISEATLKDCQAKISIGEKKTIQAKGIIKEIKAVELIGIEANSLRPSSAETSQKVPTQ